MRREFFLAIAGYVLPTFPLGYLWHLSTFKANYEALEIYRADVVIPLGLASMMIQGVIIAWLYPKLFSTARRDWLKSAAKFFATIGVLSWSFIVLPVAAKFDMTSVADFMLLETGFVALQFLVVSPLVVFAWRRDA